MWEVGRIQAFEEWWSELSEQEQDDVTAIVELPAEMGPKLPSPTPQASKAHTTAIGASCAFNPMEIR